MSTKADISVISSKSEHALVFPNPVNDKATIAFSAGDHKKAKIDLVSLMGQNFASIETEVKSAGDYEETIDFKAMNLERRIYFINTTIGDHSQKQKVVYTKAN